MSNNYKKLLEFLTEDISDYDLEADIILAEIAGKISAQRILRNMTQSDFAKLLGVNQSMISKIEKGDYNFTIRNLIKIAHCLEVPCEILFGSNNILSTTKNKEPNVSDYIYSNGYKSNIIDITCYSAKRNKFSPVLEG